MQRSALFITLLLCFNLFASFDTLSEEHKIAYNNPFDVQLFSSSKDFPNLYENYRKDWVRLTGFELSALHWSQFVTVFINKSPKVYSHNYYESVRAYEDEDEDEVAEINYLTYPVGTIVAKEGFMSHKGMPGAPLFIVFMKKHKKGYDSKYGDWEYFKFSPDGTTLLQGNTKNPAVMSECAGCHINMAERDYIFTSFFSDKR